MGEAKLILALVMLVLVSSPVLAYHNRFDPYVDLNNINWFDAGLYFNSLPHQPCIDLEEYYAYADWDPYDRYDRDDLERDLDRLGYTDVLLITDKNPYDNLDRNDIRDVEDLRCSTKHGFDTKAHENRYDNWDDDDYYEWLGYKNQVAFENQLRHFPYELDRRYQRESYGAIASYYPIY